MLKFFVVAFVFMNPTVGFSAPIVEYDLETGVLISPERASSWTPRSVPARKLIIRNWDESGKSSFGLKSPTFYLVDYGIAPKNSRLAIFANFLGANYGILLNINMGLMYQFIGKSQKEAKAGNFSFSALASLGHLFYPRGTKLNSKYIDGGSGSTSMMALLTGLRLTDFLMIYSGPHIRSFSVSVIIVDQDSWNRSAGGTPMSVTGNGFELGGCLGGRLNLGDFFVSGEVDYADISLKGDSEVRSYDIYSGFALGYLF